MEQGGLKRGDQILSVNNISLEGLTHQEAVNILKNCEDLKEILPTDWSLTTCAWSVSKSILLKV